MSPYIHAKGNARMMAIMPMTQPTVCSELLIVWECMEDLTGMLDCLTGGCRRAQSRKLTSKMNGPQILRNGSGSAFRTTSILLTDR